MRIRPLVIALIMAAGTAAAAGPAVPDTASGYPDAYEDNALARETSAVRWMFMKAIRIYQKLVSPQYGDVCNFHPSCSHYGFEAYWKAGPVQGTLLTADRLQRCHRCASGHYLYDRKHRKLADPVEDHMLWGTSGNE